MRPVAGAQLQQDLHPVLVLFFRMVTKGLEVDIYGKEISSSYKGTARRQRM